MNLTDAALIAQDARLARRRRSSFSDAPPVEPGWAEQAATASAAKATLTANELRMSFIARPPRRFSLRVPWTLPMGWVHFESGYVQELSFNPRGSRP